MNPQVKVKWLHALRSGEYRQGRYRLKGEGGGFCCLGVLCDVYSKDDEGKGRWEWKPKDGGWKFVTDDLEFEEQYLQTVGISMEWGETVLPPLVVEWAGLDNVSPRVFAASRTSHLKSPQEYALADLNDGGYENFDAIADLIESEL